MSKTKTVKITVLNSVWGSLNKYGAQFLNNELCYKDKNWGAAQYGGSPLQETVRMIEAHGDGKYYFPIGLLHRAITYLKKTNTPFKIINETEFVSYKSPKIEGIKLRDYQYDLIMAFLEAGRGVIKSPTATGKSIIIAGIVSAFRGKNVLFLAHTKDLVLKMKGQLQEMLNTDAVGEWTADRKVIKPLTVATVQSYVNVCKNHSNYWDVILIDEGHHVSSPDGQYAKVLSCSRAPVKGALTATMPYIPKAKISLEAYVGPLIGEYTIEEANEDNVLAKPSIKIKEVGSMPYQLLLDAKAVPRKVNKDGKKTKPSTYEVVYWNGIVTNVTRNLMVLEEAYKSFKKGKSVLINVIRIPHGEILMQMVEDHYPDMKVTFVSGKTEDRDSIIKQFEKKKIKVVIATTVFNEGIDITTLNCCINAAGGKSEIATLQKVGRGLRKTKDKTKVKIVDFKDTCHPILLNHYRKRERMYKQNDWLKAA